MPRSFDASATAAGLAQDLAAHIADKVVLTTGVSPNSIGATFVEALAAHARPRLLILAGRSLSKLQQTADAVAVASASSSCSSCSSSSSAIETRLLQLDLTSLDAVRTAAAVVHGWADVPAIDVLVNNAGVMAVSDYTLSKDGVELQFAVNHLAHFLFTNLLMGKIVAATDGGRVVNVSSDGHRLAPIRWGDWNFRDGKTYNKWQAYGQSKTANMLFSVALAAKLGGGDGSSSSSSDKATLLAFSLHPGVVPSNLGSHLDWENDIADLRTLEASLGNAQAWQDFKFVTEQEGAATHVYAAFEPSLSERNGAYLQESRIADPWTDTVRPWATDKTEAMRLWKLSEQLVGEEFEH
ncbi:NAD(P)-binding protein [Coniella lustricola]|uniref:NAD(P)-binding protein n=1 Tax=Coniella lustricola TaxID=2025994 RepID=A0A2T2ZTD6_9PEZI|nr:NAD(P)-binding protein [Coniella lustricola]